MSFVETAKAKVLECADVLEVEARRVGILRSMDATNASNWLKHVAKELRGACVEEEDPVEAKPAEPPILPLEELADVLTLQRYRDAGLDLAQALIAQNVARDIIEEVEERLAGKGVPRK